MKKYTIVGTKLSDNEALVEVSEERINIPFTYLHGNLLEDHHDIEGWDIFDFVEEYPEQEGIYPIEVLLPNNEVRECTLFMWRTTYLIFKGLVTYNEDKDSEGYNYALNRYNTKSAFI